MSDISDVETVLVTTLAAILYPNGTANASALGVDARIYRGWPTPDGLDTDLRAGKLNISVFPLPMESKETRYNLDWMALPPAAVGLTLSVIDDTVTVGGTPQAALNVALLVNGRSYVYPVQAGDSLTAIATGLAALVSQDTPATNNGPILTIPGAYSLTARVGGFNTIVQELGRQRRALQITLWCPTPALRDQAAKLVDPALRAMQTLLMPDGVAARFIYERSHVTDSLEREACYRRDLVYTAEYATTISQQAPAVTVINIDIDHLPSAGIVLLEDGSGGIEREDGSGVIDLEIS